jgi:hypothetical protein
MTVIARRIVAIAMLVALLAACGPGGGGGGGADQPAGQSAQPGGY